MNNEQFSTALGFSIAGHLALLLFGILNVYLFKDKITTFENAIRVDLVALPDKPSDAPPKVSPQPVEAAPTPTIPVPPKPETKPVLPTKAEEKPKAPVDKTAINLNQVKKKQEEALQKLKQQSAIERLQEQLKNEAVTAAAAKQVKGNILSQGTDVQGLNKIQFDQYYSQVDRHIRQFWALPPFLKGRGLQASVKVLINASGQVIFAEIFKPSGNSQFDDMALSSANESSPVPAPPEKFQKIFQNEGFIINFKE